MIIRIAAALLFLSNVTFTQLRKLESAESKYFEVKYEKSLSKDDLRASIAASERVYKKFKEKFGFSFSQKKKLYIFGTVARFRYESGSKAFPDGDYRNYNLYVVLPEGRGSEARLEEILSRVISRALLDELPACPPWFAEAYSLYAGNELERVGKPFHLNISAFADLGEDYSRSLDKRGLSDLYSKLGVTIRFMLDQYGEKRIEAAIRKFHEGKLFQEAFPAVFNEPMDEIERKWIRYLKEPPRE